MNKPLYVEFDLERRSVRIVYQTQPSFEEWKSTMEAVLEDPRFERGFGILLDRSRILKPATSEYMNRLVDFVDRHAETAAARWAILASDLGSFGIGRKAELATSTASIRAFTDRNAAELWLSER